MRLRLFVLLLVIGVLLARQAASFLVVDHPEKSDAIVVLAGEARGRPALGLELLRQGMAPRMFLDAETAEEIYDQQLTDIANKYVTSLPEADRVRICAIEGRSTAAETEDVARCLQSTGAHRILIVTSDYHTRRALAIFSKRLPQYHFSIAAAHNLNLFSDRWWTQREWAKTTVNEWFRLLWWEGIDRWR
jgi:DUF218 domain